MYPVSSAVKALFDAEQRQVLRITGTDKNGTSISITDANVEIGGFNIDRYCCNGEKLEVGTAIAGQMTLKLNNVNGAFSGIAFEGAELFAEIGIADWSQSSPTINWIPCGYFTPDMQPRKLNKIELTCLDRMTRFEAVVDEAALTLPTTVAGLVGQVNTLCGVTLAADISTLPNANVVITALPNVAGDMTYRNIIQWCAGIMATNAWFDWNGQLRFTWYDGVTGYETTTANRFSSDFFEDDLTITGAVYTNASGVEIVEGTDDYAIDLTGNALVGPIVATVLPAVNTAVNGFVYRPFTAVVTNAPYLWPMDLVDFTDKDGNTYSGALTNVAFGLNRHTALESKGLTYALNERAQPKGVTKEQAQLITQAMEQVETDIDESLTQEDIFNRLTDNGTAQGLILTQDGQLYVNASYIRSGTLVVGGLNNQSGTIEVRDANNNNIGTWDNMGFIVRNSNNGIKTALNYKYLAGSNDTHDFVSRGNGHVLLIDDGTFTIWDGDIEPVTMSARAALTATSLNIWVGAAGGAEVKLQGWTYIDPDGGGISEGYQATTVHSTDGLTFENAYDGEWFSLDREKMAYNGEIDANLAVTYISSNIITPNSGVTVYWQRLRIIGGHFYEMELRLQLDSDMTARKVLGTINSDYLPGRTYNAICPAASTINGVVNSYVNCFMSTNGNLTADYTGSAVREVFVNMTFIM